MSAGDVTLIFRDHFLSTATPGSVANMTYNALETAVTGPALLIVAVSVWILSILDGQSITIKASGVICPRTCPGASVATARPDRI